MDEATWSTVQNMLDDDKRVTNRVGTERRHLGSGLFLCGVCGKKVRGSTHGYQCAGHIVRARSHVDPYVIQQVRRRLAEPDPVDLLPEKNDDRVAEINEKIRNRDREETAIAKLEAERLRLAAGRPSIPQRWRSPSSSDHLVCRTQGQIGTEGGYGSGFR